MKNHIRRVVAVLLCAVILATMLTHPVNAMEIYVHIAVDGTDFVLDVEPGDTIDQVKAKIQDQESIPVERQTLFFNGVQLVDGQTLADYNILKGNTIDLIVKSFYFFPMIINLS